MMPRGNKVTSAALAEYDKVTSAAWAEYKKKTKGGNE